MSAPLTKLFNCSYPTAECLCICYCYKERESVCVRVRVCVSKGVCGLCESELQETAVSGVRVGVCQECTS